MTSSLPTTAKATSANTNLSIMANFFALFLWKDAACLALARSIARASGPLQMQLPKG